jgi:large subunit ribosomal protein L23
MNAYQVIKTVAVTEKSNDQTAEGKYTFLVNPQATKHQIKVAVETLFERKVAAVNVLNRAGKARRTRYGLGKRPDTRRAVVTLREGQEPINFF